MKLADVKCAYEDLSNIGSSIVRQLSLAGIAVIWIFKSGTGATPLLEKQLVHAALFIFGALFCDLLQYLVGSTTLFIYYRYKECKKTKPDDEFSAPPSLNWPTWALFYLKSGMMVWAYAHYILPFLASKFWLS